MSGRIIASLIALVFLSGCAHLSQTTWKIEQPDDMRTALVQRIPQGTNLATARRTMESEGFTCELKRNSTFVESKSSLVNDGTAHEGIDFLECRRLQSAGFLMSRRWTVALVLKGDSVDDILISHILDGP